jgi:hypothetical protein
MLPLPANLRKSQVTRVLHRSNGISSNKRGSQTKAAPYIDPSPITCMVITGMFVNTHPLIVAQKFAALKTLQMREIAFRVDGLSELIHALGEI